MTPVLQTAVGLAIPFVGTALGAAAVFLFKSNIPPRVQKILLGFASGVMLAASVWSLLLPALELSGSWLPRVPVIVLRDWVSVYIRQKNVCVLPVLPGGNVRNGSVIDSHSGGKSCIMM